MSRNRTKPTNPPLETEPLTGQNAADCAFCAIITSQTNPDVYVPVTDDFVAFPAKHQRSFNRGHMLLVPVGHYTTLDELPATCAAALPRGLALATTAVRQAFDATGVTVRINLGRPAQDMAHLHIHVIPRRPDDLFDATTSEEVPLEQRIQQLHKLHTALRSHRDRHDP